MDYKILYVLVSTKDDYYYEQLLFSIMSLRNKNRKIHIEVLTDNSTYDSLCNTREEIKDLVNNFTIVKLNKSISNKEKSRILKTSMRLHVNGDFLFIDTDTLICDLGNIKKLEIEMGAVLDCHATSNEYIGQKRERIIAEKRGYENEYNIYFNSGVLWCKDSEYTREFFREWSNLYLSLSKYEIKSDQISFNITNKKYNYFITELAGEYNCQVRYGAKYFRNCKILHYGGSSTFDQVCELCQPAFFLNYKKTAVLNDYYKGFINDPLSSIRTGILYDIKAHEIQCESFLMLRYLYRKKSKVFLFIENICMHIHKIRQKLRRK